MISIATQNLFLKTIDLYGIVQGLQKCHNYPSINNNHPPAMTLWSDQDGKQVIYNWWPNNECV